MTVGQTAGALVLPMLARHEDRRKLLMLALALQLFGFCGFIWLPQQWPLLWAVSCGVGLGGAFPLCLVLALDHSPQPAVARSAGGVYAGRRFYYRRVIAMAFGAAAQPERKLPAGLGIPAICVFILMALTLRFVPRTLSASVARADDNRPLTSSLQGCRR